MGAYGSGGGAAHKSASGGVGAPRLRVAPENVLGLAAALVDEAAGFRAKVAARLDAMRLAEPPGRDPVSWVVAEAFNRRFWRDPDSLAQRYLDYADHLDLLADQLAAAARHYGHTEDAISAAFANRDPDFDRGELVGDGAVDRPGGALRSPRAV